MVIFFHDNHNRHPMAHLWGWHMRRPLWVKILINVFRPYMILTTDTQCLVRKGDTWGDLCVFKFWLMYRITTWSSQKTLHKGDTWGVPCEFKVELLYCISTWSLQQTSHCSPIRAIHGVTPVSSNSGWCITSLQGPHNRHPMARP